MKMCIAEKPSVAKEIANILGATTRRNGYLEGNGYCVTWTFGHLCTLQEPGEYTEKWQKWNLGVLPMIPSKFRIRLIEDEGIKKQFAVIEELVSKAEMVINCGDAGQEGELIQRWVLTKAKCGVPIKRLWISSLTEEAIREGFEKLMESQDFDTLYAAGSARAIGDWLLGMNATRAYTLKYGTGKNVLSIGRVQTPTLALVVERQKAIENFKPETYWEIRTNYREGLFSCLRGRFNKKEEAEYYLKCSYNYRNLYNKETAFFHPKDKEGHWIEPFDYRYPGGMGAREYYGENNGWVYRWDVPHNVADLISLMGGKEQFIANLDRTFTEPLGRSKYEFYAKLPDHTGNVGQFSMANEPSLHVPYLYNYAGQPWKTQKRIRQMLKTWFRNDLMGIPGDEDGGGMTSFVVFSSLGFYPVTPGLPVYNIGSPLFTNAKVTLSNGAVFEIEAQNTSADNKYIQSATLNGKEWNKSWFSHEDLKDGGKLVLVMGSKPNKAWGSGAGDVPPSLEMK